MSDFDPAKLAALQARASKLSSGGAKGPVRRKAIPKNVANAGDDKKVQLALKKLNVQPIGSVDEVNMFLEESSNVIHFQNPKVHAATGSNTYAIYGQAQTRELSDLVPSGILSQLGPEAMAQLKRLAEQIQAGSLQNPAAAGGAGGAGEGADGEGEEVPELVEATEGEQAEGEKLEDLN
ncbi:Egd1p [Sporobolomyces salmoneus]|uniref:Egd1p n=1 Tax=Sporobolomyces salmoneus TaxID=183962 RepID=UPI00316E8493